MSDAAAPSRLCFDSKTRRIGLRVGKVELGQHIHAAYRVMVADALGVAEDRISVLPVTTTDSPDDGLTVGSLSVQVTGRQIEASVQSQMDALRQAAALKLSAAPAELTFEAADLAFRIGDRTCDLFDLLGASEVADIAGNSPNDVASAVLGQTRYIQDLTWPNMLHARALRGRSQETVETSLTPSDQIIEDGGFAAIVSPDEARINAIWAALPVITGSGDKTCDGPVRQWIETCRTIMSGDECSDRDFPNKVTTSRPFLLHGSIAPSCGVALWDHGVLTVWTHSQGIFPLRAQIARVVQLEMSQVSVRHVRSAGCYGHNGADDAAMDAVLVAMRNEGRPVRVQWPREDDMRLAPLGAPMLVTASARLDTDNRITDWHQDVHSAPHGQRPGGGGHVNLLAAIERDPSLRPSDIHDLPAAVGHGAGRNATPIYDIPHVTARTNIIQDLPVRTSSLRGLGAQMNTVAIEMMMDHLARQTGQSAFEFRARHLSDSRARAVLDRLERDLPQVGAPDEAIGIAMGRYKNKAAYAGVAVHLKLADEPQLLNVRAVVDAGRVISPDGARNQIEGGILQAASWTLCEAVLLRDGQIDAMGWEDYPTLTWDRIPKLDVTLMPTDDEPPLGVGECMVGPTSAAIVNAITAILGQPVSHLPLNRDALISALS